MSPLPSLFIPLRVDTVLETIIWHLARARLLFRIFQRAFLQGTLAKRSYRQATAAWK